MEKTYFSPEALSVRWDLPLTTLSQWRWHGKGPEFSKMGRRVRYELKDIEDTYLEQAIQDAWSTRKNNTTITDVAKFLLHHPDSIAVSLGERLHPYTDK